MNNSKAALNNEKQIFYNEFFPLPIIILLSIFVFVINLLTICGNLLVLRFKVFYENI